MASLPKISTNQRTLGRWAVASPARCNRCFQRVFDHKYRAALHFRCSSTPLHSMANDLVRDMGLPQDYRPKSATSSSQPLSLKEALGRCVEDIQGCGSVEEFPVRRRSSSVHADQVLHAMLYGDVDQVWEDPRYLQQKQLEQLQQHQQQLPRTLRRTLSMRAKGFINKCLMRKTHSDFTKP